MESYCSQILSQIPVSSILDASLSCVSVETALNKASKVWGEGEYVGYSLQNLVSEFQQAAENVALETANKSAAFKPAPYSHIFIDTMFIGYDIYNVYKGWKNTFNDKDSRREVCTKIIGKIASSVGSAIGALGGTPSPGVGACTRSALVKLAGKCAPFIPVIKDTMDVGYDIYNLYTGSKNDKNYQREVCTKIFGSIGSFAGSTIGALVGTLFPGVGTFIGSTLGTYAGNAFLSRVSGFLFDKLM